MRVSGILIYNGREYVVNTPALEEKVFPFVLFLHGGTGDGPTFRTQMDIGATLGEDVILVFPTATINQDAFTAWNCGGPFNPLADDVTYLDGLINAMIATGRVDANNIWIVGHSNGGMLGYRLICEEPGTWRGLYSISGDLMEEITNPDTFTGKLRETHGVDDENVPILGGLGEDSFYPIDYASLYDVVPSFTQTISSILNPLANTGHSVASIKTGLITQGTTLQQDISNFIYM